VCSFGRGRTRDLLASSFCRKPRTGPSAKLLLGWIGGVPAPWLVLLPAGQLILWIAHEGAELAVLRSAILQPPSPQGGETDLCSLRNFAFSEESCVHVRLAPFLAQKFPWPISLPLYDLIHRRLEAEHKKARIAHRVSHAEQVPALLHDDSFVAWLTPTGAERIARNGLVRIPLVDSEINLEMHLASLANNKSRLVS